MPQFIDRPHQLWWIVARVNDEASFSRITKNGKRARQIGSRVAFLHEYTRATCTPRKVAGAEPCAGFLDRGFTSISWGEERGMLRAPRASHLTHPGRGNRTKNRRHPLGTHRGVCARVHARAACRYAPISRYPRFWAEATNYSDALCFCTLS